MYILTLIANNGEIVTLNYETYQKALSMKNSFMLMGQYSDSFIKKA